MSKGVLAALFAAALFLAGYCSHPRPVDPRAAALADSLRRAKIALDVSERQRLNAQAQNVVLHRALHAQGREALARASRDSARAAVLSDSLRAALPDSLRPKLDSLEAAHARALADKDSAYAALHARFVLDSLALDDANASAARFKKQLGETLTALEDANKRAAPPGFVRRAFDAAPFVAAALVTCKLTHC